MSTLISAEKEWLVPAAIDGFKLKRTRDEGRASPEIRLDGAPSVGYGGHREGDRGIIRTRISDGYDELPVARAVHDIFGHLQAGHIADRDVIGDVTRGSQGTAVA